VVVVVVVVVVLYSITFILHLTQTTKIHSNNKNTNGQKVRYKKKDASEYNNSETHSHTKTLHVTSHYKVRDTATVPIIKKVQIINKKYFRVV